MDRNQIDGDADNDLYWSPSTRRAWIEISGSILDVYGGESPSTRRAWIEIFNKKIFDLFVESPSTRRAWIEIYGATLENGMVADVALHPEGVDRNGGTRVS